MRTIATAALVFFLVLEVAALQHGFSPLAFIRLFGVFGLYGLVIALHEPESSRTFALHRTAALFWLFLFGVSGLIYAYLAFTGLV